MRPTWDSTWMNVALDISYRSRCVNRQAGAVLVGPDNRVIATGYNGPPAGLDAEPVSCDRFCPRALGNAPNNDYSNCVSIHAEANALLFCDRSRRAGGTLYITSPPCWDCAKLMANSGIARVVYKFLDRGDPLPGLQLLTDCGVEVVCVG